MDRVEKIKKQMEKMNKDKKRNPFTMQMKYDCLMVLEGGMKQVELAKKLGITKTTLNTWVRKKKDILLKANSGQEMKRQKNKDGNYPELSRALFTWLCGVTSTDTDARINGPEFKEKAEKLAKEFYRKGDETYKDFTCSEGFLCRWKKRFQVSVKRATGEKNSALPGAVEDFIESTMKEILEK